jgi:hypothetical protein
MVDVCKLAPAPICRPSERCIRSLQLQLAVTAAGTKAPRKQLLVPVTHRSTIVTFQDLQMAFFRPAMHLLSNRCQSRTASGDEKFSGFAVRSVDAQVSQVACSRSVDKLVISVDTCAANVRTSQQKAKVTLAEAGRGFGGLCNRPKPISNLDTVLYINNHDV